jgi:hypothetical protein
MIVPNNALNSRLMKYTTLLFIASVHFGLLSQIDNTMYGLYQSLNPPSFQFSSLDPVTGQVTAIGTSVLSENVNSTGSSLNPYNQTYSYQDGDSWLSINVQTGAILNDVNIALPGTNAYFNNFRFNTADSNMYGLYSQVTYDSLTGTATGDMRLATCDLTNGQVNILSPSSIAESYTMSGSTIDPYLMVYYFESEDKFVGLDLYNGQVYSEPAITIPSGGSSFDNFAYSCADTAVYGLIMQNGVKALGKINPQTGVVSALPTVLNYENCVMNSGGTIDPVNLVYYFLTLDPLGPTKMVGLSLLDGSVVSESIVSLDGDYFIMYRIQSDCYGADVTRLNPLSNLSEIDEPEVHIQPNPAQDLLSLNAAEPIIQVEILDAHGNVIQRSQPYLNNVDITIQLLSKGVYYLRIMTNASTNSYRFIKI